MDCVWTLLITVCGKNKKCMDASRWPKEIARQCHFALLRAFPDSASLPNTLFTGQTAAEPISLMSECPHCISDAMKVTKGSRKSVLNGITCKKWEQKEMMQETRAHTHTFVYLKVNTHTCVYIYIHTQIKIYIYKSIYVYIYIYIYINK